MLALIQDAGMKVQIFWRLGVVDHPEPRAFFVQAGPSLLVNLLALFVALITCRLQRDRFLDLLVFWDWPLVFGSPPGFARQVDFFHAKFVDNTGFRLFRPDIRNMKGPQHTIPVWDPAGADFIL